MPGHKESFLHDAPEDDIFLDVSSHIGLALFWTNIAIDVLGLIGNLLTIIVLAHRKMRCSTSMLLITMGLYDSVFLITELGYSLSEVVFNHIQTRASAHPTVLCIAGTGSIYTAVAVTAERYMAVKHPIRARIHCHLSGVWKTIVGIFVVSLAINLPRMAAIHETNIAFHGIQNEHIDMDLDVFPVNETKINLEDFGINSTNMDVRAFGVNQTNMKSQTFWINGTNNDLHAFRVKETNMEYQTLWINDTNRNLHTFRVKETDAFRVNETNMDMDFRVFRNNETSVIFVDCYTRRPIDNPRRFIYCNMFPAVVILVIPFAVILVFNSLILITLSQRRRRRSLATIMTSVPDKGRGLTHAALGITFCFFLFCGFPGIFYIVRFAFRKSFGDADHIMNNVSYTLLLINFSTNFILYCFLGKTFRNIFLDLIGFNEERTRRRSSNISSIRNRSWAQSSIETDI